MKCFVYKKKVLQFIAKQLISFAVYCTLFSPKLDLDEKCVNSSGLIEMVFVYALLFKQPYVTLSHT